MAGRVHRLLRHLFARSARTIFTNEVLHRIADAVAAGESRHRGEVCFAVESGLTPAQVFAGMQARARANDVFAQLKVWETDANNGVLVYLLLADHRIEIIADRGLRDCVSDAQWRGVCQLMEERLRAGDAEAAAIVGVQGVSDILAGHFPRAAGVADENELPDLPHIL